MMRHDRGSERPVTIYVCAGCGTAPVLSRLRATVRRCPHAVLVSTGCMLGPITCAAHPAGRGATVVVQPCARDRTPCGPARFVGPITDDAAAGEVCAWLERGDWNLATLPDRLRGHRDLAEWSARVN